jgi:hypothetical protein
MALAHADARAVYVTHDVLFISARNIQNSEPAKSRCVLRYELYLFSVVEETAEYENKHHNRKNVAGIKKVKKWSMLLHE